MESFRARSCPRSAAYRPRWTPPMLAELSSSRISRRSSSADRRPPGRDPPRGCSLDDAVVSPPRPSTKRVCPTCRPTTHSRQRLSPQTAFSASTKWPSCQSPDVAFAGPHLLLGDEPRLADAVGGRGVPRDAVRRGYGDVVAVVRAAGDDGAHHAGKPAACDRLIDRRGADDGPAGLVGQDRHVLSATVQCCASSGPTWPGGTITGASQPMTRHRKTW